MIGTICLAALQTVRAFADTLASTQGEGVDETRLRLEQQDISPGAFRHPPVQQKDVCRYFGETLEMASIHQPQLGSALRNLENACCWMQSESYSDEVLGEGFSKNYGWCEIIGKHGFFPGNDFIFGFLLLGPSRHYLDHYHPAPELYWPLTEPSRWKKGDGEFVSKSAGSFIWHPSMTVHATITEGSPLLAAYAWTRDTVKGARLCALDQR